MIEIRTSQKDSMSIKNKFDVTTKKFYLVFNDNDTTADKEAYTTLLNGSISDYLGFESTPMVMYAGRAIKYLKRNVESAAKIIEEGFWNPDDFKKAVSSCSVALAELKSYDYYDLVGVYQVENVYKIVDYKKVSEVVQKECGYRFVEIQKEIYVKLAKAENKRKNSQTNKTNVIITQTRKSFNSIKEMAFDSLLIVLACMAVAGIYYLIFYLSSLILELVMP